MIEFKKITDDNFSECVKLNPGEGNDKFVAPNISSLAEAYVAISNDEGIPIPFAIYKDQTMVGFIQLAYVTPEQDDDLDDPIYEVWRFMIDHKYQGKGYGKAALTEAIAYMRTFPHGPAKKAYLSYVPGNGHARGLYLDVGFKETGDEEHGEIVMAIEL